MRLLATSTFLCIGLLPAQHTAHPIDNLTSGVSQNIPFAGNSTSWDEARSQFLFLAPFLPSTGGLLTAVELVPNTSYLMQYERFEIWMDLTSNSTLSTTFANNLTNPILVYSQSPGVVSWVGGAWTTITLQQPFPYDGVSNLVMEVRKKIDRINTPPAVAVSHRVLVNPRRADLPVPIWAFGAYGSGAVDAAVATTTYNTQVLTHLVWANGPTLTIDCTRATTAANYYALGSTFTATAHGNPGELFITALSTSLLPIGIPLPPIQGQVWVNNPQILGLGLLDAVGDGASSLTLPGNANLVGLRLFCQSATVGAATVLTNVVDGVINP